MLLLKRNSPLLNNTSRLTREHKKNVKGVNSAKHRLNLQTTPKQEV